MTDLEKLKELEGRLRTYALAEDIFGQERHDLEVAADLLASLASKDAEIERLKAARDEAREDNRIRLVQRHYDDAFSRVVPIIADLTDSPEDSFSVETAANDVIGAAFYNGVSADARAEAAESRLTTALAALGEAREALEPFAKEAVKYDPDNGDGDMPPWDSHAVLTIGDLRKARATLAKINALERQDNDDT